MIVFGHAVTVILLFLISTPCEPLQATDDDLNTLIKNFRKLARLSNSVSIEIGLLDGSIPSADVISELLQIGSAKDLIDFDSTRIDAAISEIQSLNDKWDTSPEVAAIENRLVFLEWIRSSFDWAELKSLVRRDEYKKELGVVATGKKWVKVTNPAEIERATSQISKLPLLLAQVEDIAKNLNATLAEFEFARDIKSKSTFLQILDLERDLRTNLSISVPFTDESLKKLGENLKIFNTAREKTVTAQPQIKIIQNLIQRLPRYEYTAGLPEGAEELDKLKSDVEDDWIGEHIKDKEVVRDSLESVFSNFHDKIGEDSGDLKAVIELGRDEKILEDSDVQKLNQIMKNIIDSKILLKQAIRSAERINEIKTRESLSLKTSFPKSKEVSRRLGIAVRGLVAIKVAYEQKEKLKPLLNIGGFRSLRRTFTRIDNFLTTLNETRRESGSDFKSLGIILNHADKIPGFLKTMRDLLDETSPEKQTALDILEDLDLDFEKFGFNGATESLEAMDQFFLDYVKVMTTESSTRVYLYTTQSPPKESAVAEEESEQITPASISGKTLLICTIVTLAILSCLLIFVTVQIGCSKYRNAGKSKEKSGNANESVTEKTSQMESKQ